MIKCSKTIMPDLGLAECKQFYGIGQIGIGQVVSFIDPNDNKIIGKVIDFKSNIDGTITYKIKKL